MYSLLIKKLVIQYKDHEKSMSTQVKDVRQESVGSSDFRCFPARYDDFSAHFLQDPAGYGGRNLRPG